MNADWFSSIRLLHARKIAEYCGQRMPHFDAAASLAWSSEERPGLVVFVSHRWRSSTHPDPDGRTLRAISYLLLALDSLACGLDPTDDAPVPDLREPAMLHASVLLHRFLEYTDWEGEPAIDRIAVFFDYQSQGLNHRL